jgi:PPK2 family polyphosphate:nucleotide phosphotransferase
MQCKQYIYDPTTPLKRLPTSTMGDFRDDDDARAYLREQAESLSLHHAYMMAHQTHGLVVIFQGMDAAGKDEAIRHVMSVVDPQGCEVKMFKAPTEKEVRHDYLWRAACSAPARGQIGIFNRSYYEHVVAERVHPDRVEKTKLPPEAMREIYARRFGHIASYEQYLIDNGVHVVKLFFHVSKEVQRQRLIERIDRPDKRWDFTPDDVEEREHWDDYMRYYDDAFRHTSSEQAPWYVIPSDERWFSRATAATIITEKLRSLHDEWPEVAEDPLSRARRELERQATDETD